MKRRDFFSDAPSLAIATAIGTSESKASSAGLFDADAVRASLPRLFSGEWDEITSELLQNSQRAGAKNVSITVELETNKVILTWSDDGCGLDGSDASFRNLLAIGASGWDDEVRRNQSPLGLGLHALLAHEDVRRVIITGGGREIEIDRDRWWQDPSYYMVWQDLIRNSKDRKGLQLQVTIAPRLARQNAVADDMVRNVTRQAKGYCDLMAVTVNTELVKPRAPEKDGRRGKPEGCDGPVRPEPAQAVAGDSHLSVCRINWYGQTLYCNLSDGNAIDTKYGSPNRVVFSVVVRDGSPFDLRSPSRKGVVGNAKWQDFVAGVGDRCGEELSKRSSPPSPRAVWAATQTWPKLKTRIPWCVLSTFASSRSGGETSVVRYAELDQYVVLDSEHATVFVEDDDDGFFADFSDRDTDRDLLSVLPYQLRHKLRKGSGGNDPARMTICSLEFHLSREREDLTDGVTLYGACEARIVLEEKILERVKVVDATSFVDETTSYALDDAKGVVFDEDEDPDLEHLLRQFWSPDEEERDESEKQFDDELTAWLHTRAGGGDFIHDRESISSLVRKLGYMEGTTLKVLHEKGSLWGFEITPPGGAPRKLRVL